MSSGSENRSANYRKLTLRLNSSRKADISLYTSMQTWAILPTPAASPVKLIPAVANEEGLSVYHFDVHQTPVYVRITPLFFSCGELYSKVIRLLKGQYSSKQADRQIVIHGLQEIYLPQSKAESCYFLLMPED